MCFGKKRPRGDNSAGPRVAKAPAAGTTTANTSNNPKGDARKANQPAEDDRIVQEVVALRLFIQNHVDNFVQPQSQAERRDALKKAATAILQLQHHAATNHPGRTINREPCWAIIELFLGDVANMFRKIDMINFLMPTFPCPAASSVPKAQRDAHLKELFNLCSRVLALFESQKFAKWEFDMDSLSSGNTVFPALRKGAAVVRQADTM